MCGLEFPDLDSLWRERAGEGLVVLGIDEGGLWGGDTEEILRAFAEQTGVTFPLLLDPDRAAVQGYDFGPSISPYPLDVIVDRDGVVRYLGHEYDAAALRAAVESVL